VASSYLVARIHACVCVRLQEKEAGCAPGPGASSNHPSADFSAASAGIDDYNSTTSGYHHYNLLESARETFAV